MALDPTRRTITYDGRPAVNVSVLWVQQRLNALLAGRAVPLVEDGVWGTNTQSAGAQYLLTVLGVDRATGMLRGESYEGTVDPASSRRAIITPALERAFSGDAPGTDVPAAGGASFAIGLAALASLGLYMATRSRGGLKGFRAPGFKRPPRVGTRVVFDPNPASMALYSTHPRVGEAGTVRPVAMGGGRSAAYMRGPGGGLVYVDWDESRFQGVSLHDLSKEK